MKAAICQRYGAPDVVTVREVPAPEPRDDEVLVRVHAATVGVVDSLARQGAPAYARLYFGLRRPRFPVLGTNSSTPMNSGSYMDSIGPTGTGAGVAGVSFAQSGRSFEPSSGGSPGGAAVMVGMVVLLLWRAWVGARCPARAGPAPTGGMDGCPRC